MASAVRADVHLWSYARQAGRVQDGDRGREVELEKGRKELTEVLTGCSLFFKLMAEARCHRLNSGRGPGASRRERQKATSVRPPVSSSLAHPPRLSPRPHCGILFQTNKMILRLYEWPRPPPPRLLNEQQLLKLKEVLLRLLTGGHTLHLYWFTNVTNVCAM